MGTWSLREWDTTFKSLGRVQQDLAFLCCFVGCCACVFFLFCLRFGFLPLSLNPISPKGQALNPIKPKGPKPYLLRVEGLGFRA